MTKRYAVGVSIATLRKEFTQRRLSPVELMTAIFRQMEKHNALLNAFIETYFDESLQQAHVAEQRFKTGQPRPLEGIPLSIKDSLDIEGRVTHCGSLLHAGNVAASDATCVRLFREAGAIIVGKTSCPEFLMNYETDNRIIGRTNNPWNLDRTAGGSSGGEAAAIASFCSAGGIGSDGGGSIRFPAHCCGISGLKPTPGRVSAAGHLPPIAHPGGLLGVVGPMAGSAKDVRILFDVLAQPDFADPFSTPMPLRPAPLAPLISGEQRIGWMPGWFDVPVQPAIGKAIERAVGTLTDLGYLVEPFRPASVERAPNLWWFFFGQIHSRVTQASLAGKEDQLHWTGQELLARAMSEEEPTVSSILANLAERDRLRTLLLGYMETHRVLLLPACGVTAFPHRTRRWSTGKKEIGLFEAMMPLTPFNLFGMPGMVIPFGFDDDGLPCGIQLVGRPYDEELILALAEQLEEARGTFPAPPGVQRLF